MALDRKTFRYYWWLVVEFVKKHLKLIVLSFFVSFIIIIGLISLSPYLHPILGVRSEVIGLVGQYDFNSLPDEITTKISNGLIFINEKGEVIPALASSWELVGSGREYRFHLRDNLIWNDGKAFTTKDISYNFKDVEKIIVDDKTIYFRFRKAMPTFPNYLKKPIIKYPLVGVAGLYKVDRTKTKYGYVKELSLSPNQKGLPPIKYIFYDNENQLVNAYKKGEINQMTTAKKSIADIFSSWKNTKIERSMDYSRLLTLFFDLNNPLLKEKEVRQAIIMAIDNSQFEKYGEIAVGPIPPFSWAYNPDLKNPVYQEDTAEKIIKKTVDASQSAQLKLTTYYDYLDVAEEIVKYLKNAGLNVKLNLISYDKPNNFDFLLAYWKIPFDPDQYFFWHSTQKQGNIGNYKNVKVDKLLEDGRTTLSIEERKKIYYEFQKVIQDDPPAAFIYYPYVYTIRRK